MLGPIKAAIIAALLSTTAAGTAAAAAPPPANPVRDLTRKLQKDITGAVVLIKLDMPATSHGLEVWPDRADPIAEKEYLERIKRGIALHAGETSWVSEVRVGPKSLDILLGGGGYNYIMDAGASAAAGHGIAEKSQEQLQLETDIMGAATGTDHTGMESLNELSRRRNELERKRLAGTQEEGAAPIVARSRADLAGSRFTIRFEGKLPPEDITVAYIRQTLAEYLDFFTAPASTP